MTTRRIIYVGWMLIYLLSLPIWNFVLPVYAFWHFDDFSWGATRQVEGEAGSKGHGDKEGEFDSSHITMKRWCEFEREKRKKAMMLLTSEMAVGATTFALPALGRDTFSNPFGPPSVHESRRGSVDSATEAALTAGTSGSAESKVGGGELGYAAPSTLASVVAEYETVNPSLAALRGSTIISTPQGVFALPPPLSGLDAGVSMVPPPAPTSGGSDFMSSTYTPPRSQGSRPGDTYKRSNLGK